MQRRYIAFIVTTDKGIIMTWLFKFGYAVLIMSIWLSVATAATLVNEDINDAGSLPSDAQIVDQPVDLTDGIVEIRGSIIPGDDEDMYQIQVSIPTLFSANTNILGSFIEDTRLFVFDENGNGVCANHDNPTQIPGDPNASLAVIPAGTCALTPGTYYIAISTFERYPVYQPGNSFASIFPDTPRDAVVAPIVGTGPIAGWSGTGQRGDLYIIQLKGINYPPPTCQLVGATIDGNSKTVSYLASDLNLGIASVAVNTLSLAIDQDPLAPAPEVRIPLDTVNQAVLHAGESLPIAPPRDTVTINVFNPNRFAPISSAVTVTNSVGGSIVCPSILGRDTDPNPPVCSGPQVIVGEPSPTLEEVIQDTESGIQSIQVDFLKNATLTIDGIPAGYADPIAGIENPIVFTPSTTRPIIVRAVKIDPTQRATVVVFIYDADGNMSRCDPKIMEYTVPAGRVVKDTMTDLLPTEHYVTIHNDENGVSLAAIRANNGPLHVRWMGDQVEQWIDTGADMLEGIANTMSIMLIGSPGSKSLLVIADQAPTQPAVAFPEQPAAAFTRSFSPPLKLQGNQSWGSR